MTVGRKEAVRRHQARSAGSQILFSGAKVNATLHATTGSGSVDTRDQMVKGSIEKSRVEGAIGDGGPTVRLASRSGSIRVR